MARLMGASVALAVVGFISVCYVVSVGTNRVREASYVCGLNANHTAVLPQHQAARNALRKQLFSSSYGVAPLLVTMLIGWIVILCVTPFRFGRRQHSTATQGTQLYPLFLLLVGQLHAAALAKLNTDSWSLHLLQAGCPPDDLAKSADLLRNLILILGMLQVNLWLYVLMAVLLNPHTEANDVLDLYWRIVGCLGHKQAMLLPDSDYLDHGAPQPLVANAVHQTQPAYGEPVYVIEHDAGDDDQLA